MIDTSSKGDHADDERRQKFVSTVADYDEIIKTNHQSREQVNDQAARDFTYVTNRRKKNQLPNQSDDTVYRTNLRQRDEAKIKKQR